MKDKITNEYSNDEIHIGWYLCAVPFAILIIIFLIGADKVLQLVNKLTGFSFDTHQDTRYYAQIAGWVLLIIGSCVVVAALITKYLIF